MNLSELRTQIRKISEEIFNLQTLLQEAITKPVDNRKEHRVKEIFLKPLMNKVKNFRELFIYLQL